ncbi:hypothetical protein [Cellulomonas sp. B6]|nr:hypothetical protein [Cellulomonas sp. B6]
MFPLLRRVCSVAGAVALGGALGMVANPALASHLGLPVVESLLLRG